MKHLAVFLVLGIDKIKFHHELAAVADTACIIFVERFFCFRIEEESTCPTLSRTKNVGVGETTAVNNHVYIFQRLAAADKVGHGNILHIEACQIE